MGQFSEVTCSNPLLYRWNNLTTESLKKFSVTASWHVYHRELARFHSPDKSRYDRYCSLSKLFFSFILVACMCMHARLSMWESEWKERRRSVCLEGGKKKKTIVTVVEAQHARQRGGESWQERRKQAGKKQCVIILLRKQAYVPSTAWKPRIFSTGRIWIGLSRLNEVTSANWAAQHVMMG